MWYQLQGASGNTIYKKLSENWYSPLAIIKHMAILAMTFCASDPKRVWAGGEKGILWRSDDAGQTFEAAGKPAKDGILALLPDPRRADTLIVLTESGAYGSANSGQSWRKLLGGINVLVRHPRQPDTVFAASEGIIQVSTDGGPSWRKHSDIDGKPLQLVFDRRGPRAYVVTNTGLWRSNDEGQTWEKQPKNLTGILQDPLKERRWYGREAGRPRLDDGPGFFGFDRSLPNGPEGEGDVFIAGSDFLTFVSRKGVFYRTFCGADDWTPIERRSEAGPGAEVKCVCVDPKNWKRWLAADTNGIWLTEDVAKTWTRVSEAR